MDCEIENKLAGGVAAWRSRSVSSFPSPTAACENDSGNILIS